MLHEKIKSVTNETELAISGCSSILQDVVILSICTVSRVHHYSF